MILLHATCVAVEGAGVLIRGPSGAGKSDLALRLIDDGAALVADDYCEVTADNGRLRARAPAAIAGKIEVRGYGIAQLPAQDHAIVALVVDLMAAEAIPRLPETTRCAIAGVTIAWLAVDPTHASTPAKIRLVSRALALAPPARMETGA